MEYYKKLFRSFVYAFRGVARTIKTERNMRIHITCVIYMFSILGFTDWFSLDRSDWAILVLASGAVLTCEVINTAVENAVNLATSEFSKFAEASKDAAAGAVLVSAVFAVITGIIIMYQPKAFAMMLEHFKARPAELAAFVLSIIPATLFIFLPKRKKQ